MAVRVSTRARNRDERCCDRSEEDVMDPITTESARARIQIEYIEMPDLKLTLAQVGRLCNLPKDVCEAAIASLVESGFLSTASSNSILRVGRAQRPREIGYALAARSTREAQPPTDRRLD
jgi:hypothetical protein